MGYRTRTEPNRGRARRKEISVQMEQVRQRKEKDRDRNQLPYQSDQLTTYTIKILEYKKASASTQAHGLRE